MVLDDLESAIGELCAMDPNALADAEAMVRLHRDFARLDAALTRATAAFDAGGAWCGTSAKTAAHWIAGACKLPLDQAKARLRIGRALRQMPHVEGAWIVGEISHAQVAALARARTPRTEEAFARDEEDLVDMAVSQPFRRFKRNLNYWRQTVDADGAEDQASRQEDDREVFLDQSWQDMWFGKMTFDPINGAIVANELKRLTEALLEADWAEARGRLGDEATFNDLRRTMAQRRADAMVEMAIRSASMPKDAQRPRPLFTVLVGWESLNGPIRELANGTVLTPGQIAGWLDEAWLERVVFDSASRPIDVGITRRLFTGPTRRAVQVRDRECFDEFCEERAEDCEINHIEPYGAGGETTVANGRVACGFHNRMRHKRRRP